ncbi:hypothetical protein [Flavilitoribacter nigricans]|uniref:Uncharacterized protein n=1 Tax=Flavilitoribacter nigricans (strain ATCC 23147 / DSM 23189 / NBRC 102662 / NCIMB 1420 / SS-2) TaxID=1122177 RepID=A0A2D0N150_FLAN2|nr:hypothetical protein [Flavilitoribacter nigricans]PHN02108.1 hypothetical protein CRP01_33505 [Flavilitoribacter nigricans DSM 23189 = NBRC 102662]
MKKITLLSGLLYLLLFMVGCKKETTDPETADHRNRINTVQLTFTPQMGSETRTFSYFDPDGEGGTSPQAQGIRLQPNETYMLEIDFLHTDTDGQITSLTESIRADAVSHLVCFDFLVPTDRFGVEIEDQDANQDPLGLINTLWTANEVIDDENFFVIELKHGISKVDLGPWCTYENVAVDMTATFSIVIDN